MSRWVNKPPLGTPLILGHRHLRGQLYWGVMNESAGGTVHNILDPTGDTDGVLNMDNPSSIDSGWIGSALGFNGTDDWVEHGDVFDMGLSDWAVSCWIKASILQAKRIVSKNVDASLRGWSLLTQPGGEISLIISQLGPGSAIVTTDAAVGYDDNDWHFLSGVWKRSTVGQIYWDGVLIKEGDISGLVAADSDEAASFNIGARDTGTTPFQGFIDDVRIWDRGSNPSEIQDVMHNRWAAFDDGIDVALLATGAEIAMERSISRRVHGRVFGRVN